MVVLLLLFLIVITFLFLRYDDTVVVLAPLTCFMSMFVVPFVSLDTVCLFDLVVLAIIGLFAIKGRLKLVYKCPFLICFVVMGFSYFISNAFGIEKHWVMSIAKLLTTYGFPIVLWFSIDGKKRVDLYMRSLIIFTFLLVIYALFELISNSNPIIVNGLKSHIFMNHVWPGEDIRFGVRRLQSFLPLYGSLGYTCGSVFLILLYLRFNYPSTIKISDYALFPLLGVLVLCLLFTGTRSVYLSFVIGLMVFYKKVQKYLAYALILVPVALLLLSMSSFIMDIVGSFTDTQNVEGSNSEMREEQLVISLVYWLQNPIFGNGPTYTFTTVKEADAGIQGAESIWFILMIEYGVIGCIAFLTTIIASIYYLYKNKMTPLIFLVLMFFVNKSLSSVPGISEGFFLLYIVFLVRVELLRRRDILTKLVLRKVSNG